jgi:hypothetical protein
LKSLPHDRQSIALLEPRPETLTALPSIMAQMIRARYAGRLSVQDVQLHRDSTRQ